MEHGTLKRHRRSGQLSRSYRLETEAIVSPARPVSGAANQSSANVTELSSPPAGVRGGR